MAAEIVITNKEYTRMGYLTGAEFRALPYAEQLAWYKKHFAVVTAKWEKDTKAFEEMMLAKKPDGTDAKALADWQMAWSCDRPARPYMAGPTEIGWHCYND